MGYGDMYMTYNRKRKKKKKQARKVTEGKQTKRSQKHKSFFFRIREER